MYLKDIKLNDLDSSKKYDFILPLGATEQHGPFLPFGTDTYCQDAILKRVNVKLPEVVILPTLEVTCSKEHKGFTGSLWVERDTLFLMIRDICSSIQDIAHNIFILSWHGGNVIPVNEFIEKYKNDFKSVSLYYIDQSDEGVVSVTEKILNGPIDDHAGNTEISMMLAINSDIVKLPDEKNIKTLKSFDWFGNDTLKDKVPEGIVDTHPEWVISKEMGNKFIELSAESVSVKISEIIGK